MQKKLTLDGSPTGPAWVILALLFTLQVGCGFRSESADTEPTPVFSRPVPPSRHAPFFQAGFAYSRVGGSYDSNTSSIELGKMRAAGANIAQFLTFAYVYRLNAPEIGLGEDRSDQVLRGGISRAKAAGLRAMVKLQTWGPGFCSLDAPGSEPWNISPICTKSQNTVGQYQDS